MSSDIIRTRGLTKRFRTTLAVDRLDLTVPEGAIYGFLGPNGAGKTTTLRLLAGLIRPTAGEATVRGYDTHHLRREVQACIGYLPGEVRLYEHLTGEENLSFLGRLHPRPPSRRAELQERFQLGPTALGRRVSTYSRGMLQALGIIAAFQHDPLVYLLDEPTAGLDPLMRAGLVELIEQEARRGKTILLSSHVISEVERTCNRVAVIRGGHLIFEGSLAEARDRAMRRLDVVFAQPVEIDWHSLPEVVEVQGTPRHHLVDFRGRPGTLLQKLVGQPIEDLTVASSSLEEAFLILFQQGPH